MLLYSIQIITCTDMIPRKTREQRNAEIISYQKLRRIPRLTEGSWTYSKAVIEAKARKFVVADGAEYFWNQQTCTGIKRKMRVMYYGKRKDVHLNHILSGHTRALKPTIEEKRASCAKQSATVTARNLGQVNWMEAAGIHAAMKILDPQGLLEVRLLFDGLNADFLLRPSNSTEDAWVPVQMKTGEAHDGCVYLNVKKEDGLPGGKYHGMIIIGAVLDVDRDAVKKTMEVFGAIPGVKVTELFLYGSASDIQGTSSLSPYPRRQQDDKYGDHRFVVGFDVEQRLGRMQSKVQHLVHTIPKVTYEDACCSFGPGTLNVKLNEKRLQEVLNIKALAEVVGIESLRAPALQNFTTDIIWDLGDMSINISLKTATVNNDGSYGGYCFELKAAPYAEHCHVVMAFYKEGTQRTHVSVICARRVYDTNQTCLCWSKSNNSDILDDRIDLRQPDALEQLEVAVAGVLMIEGE